MSTDAGQRDCGVLVAGAGPAGLFAALALVVAGERDVLIIDAGPDAADRRHASDLSRDLGIGWGHPDYERGVGGAGLFSDGKLCLSLDVGGHLESMDQQPRDRLETQIEGVFDALVEGSLTRRGGDPTELRKLEERARAADLEFKYYPVAHIGTDRCCDVIVRLRELLAATGVRFAPRTELLDLEVEPGGGEKLARLRDDDGERVIRAERVLLAMGKVGAERQARLCKTLGSDTHDQPLYLGVRFETEAAVLAPLFEATKDPKYSLRLADGSKVKTHCASEQGEVIPLSYEGLPLCGGHNYFNAMTGRSGFSILWDGFAHGGDPYGAAKAIMRRAHAAGGGRLVAQRLQDYRQSRPTREKDLARIDLTHRDAAGGDLREILPAAFFPAMDELLARLERLVPGLAQETAVAYAPAIEWWMERVDVDGFFRLRTAPGVSACGDGSGWSQGIVHAAATGLLAAAGLQEGEAKVDDWVVQTLERLPTPA
jgi:uncharacterized FAD-dependent dehydrogenase